MNSYAPNIKNVFIKYNSLPSKSKKQLAKLTIKDITTILLHKFKANNSSQVILGNKSFSFFSSLPKPVLINLIYELEKERAFVISSTSKNESYLHKLKNEKILNIVLSKLDLQNTQSCKSAYNNLFNKSFIKSKISQQPITNYDFQNVLKYDLRTHFNTKFSKSYFFTYKDLNIPTSYMMHITNDNVFFLDNILLYRTHCYGYKDIPIRRIDIHFDVKANNVSTLAPVTITVYYGGGLEMHSRKVNIESKMDSLGRFLNRQVSKIGWNHKILFSLI